MSLLAIDIGSSQCKAAAFTLSGEVIARSVCSYSPDFPQPGFAEMDPDKFWSAVCRTASGVAWETKHDPVQAVCLSSHGETLIPVNAKGEAVGAAILNVDNRASHEAKWCDDTIGARRIFEITGLVSYAVYPVPKILWLRKHRPEIYSSAERFLSVTDFIHTKLGLPPYIGYSLASRFLAFDVLGDRWSDEILRATELKADQLPLPVPSGTIAGNLDSAAANALGVSSGTPVIVGGHDQACGALGVGAIKSGRVAGSLGTYECLAAASDEPRLGERAFDARVNSYCHVVPGKFLTLAYFPSGIMVQWFRDLIEGRDAQSRNSSIDRDEELAPGTADRSSPYFNLEQQSTDWPTGLCVTPHLIGTCNPDFDTRARATIFGLAANSSRGQIYQGILEGIACELAQVKDLLASVNGDFKDLYVTGGGTRSPRGLKLRAALTDCRLHVMRCEAVCQGAAILAGVGSGAYARIADAVERVVQEQGIIEPNSRLAEGYANQRKQYQQLCATLKNFRDENSSSQPQGDNQ